MEPKINTNPESRISLHNLRAIDGRPENDIMSRDHLLALAALQLAALKSETIEFKLSTHSLDGMIEE